MLKPGRILIAAALLLPLAALPAAAQSPGSPPHTEGQGRPGDRRINELLKGITLSAPQTARIDSIRAAYRAKMPHFTPGVMPDSATRAQGRGLMRQANEEIRAVLTDDQRKIWDQNVETMRANRPMGGGPN